MKKKICHLVSHVNRSSFFEALGVCLDNSKYEVSFIFISNEMPFLYDYYKEKGFTVKFIQYFGKKSYPRAILETIKFFNAFKPDIVHTHLPESCVIGLTAATILDIKNRVHTRHHGSVSHLYYSKGIYYDKFINFLSKKIIATTQTVAETLIDLDKVPAKKVEIINYGYELERWEPKEGKVKELNAKYQLAEYSPVIGVISRFTHYKGVQYIIPAFKKVLSHYPKAKLILANAIGDYTPEVQKLLNELPSPNTYTLIEFEQDILALYKSFDIFIHVPIDKETEAFGQVYIEALFMGIPSVFTLSGIASEIIRDKENALVVPYHDSEAIYNALCAIMNDIDLKKRLVEGGRNDVLNLFHATTLGEKLDRFYTELTD